MRKHSILRVHKLGPLLDTAVPMRCGASTITTVVLAAVMLATWTPGCAHAQSNVDEPTFDLFSGSDVTANTNSAYVGGSYAFGNSLYGSGFRLKAAGGYGFYDYGGVATFGGATLDARVAGRQNFAEAALGYQLRMGFATIRSYLGVQTGDHHLTPNDPGNPVRGRETGPKATIETWFDLGRSAWVSSDASYTTAFDEYRASVRVGRRLGPKVAIGLESAAIGNAAYDEGRGGGFVELRFGNTAMTISGGVSGDYLEREPSGYAAVGLYRAF